MSVRERARITATIYRDVPLAYVRPDENPDLCAMPMVESADYDRTSPNGLLANNGEMIMSAGDMSVGADGYDIVLEVWPMRPINLEFPFPAGQPLQPAERSLSALAAETVATRRRAKIRRLVERRQEAEREAKVRDL